MAHPKGKKIALIGLALALAVLGAAGYSFRDLAIEEWYLWKLDSRDPAVADHAAEGLSYRGSARAIPRLLDNERWFKADLARRAIDLCGPRAPGPLKGYLSEGPGGGSPEAFLLALQSLSELEPGCREVLPAASSLLAGKGVESWQREKALKLFAKGGGDVVEELTSLLEIDDPAARFFALSNLGEIGPDAAPAIPALLELLGTEKYLFRSAWALVEIGAEKERVVARMLEKLQDRNKDYRGTAAKVIERLGKEAAAAIPFLVEDLEFPEALTAMGETALPALIEALRTGGPEKKVAALRALGSMERTPRACIPALKTALGEPDPDVSLWAALVLDSMEDSSEAPRMLAVLTRALQRKRDDVWQKSVLALPHQAASRNALPALMAEIGRKFDPRDVETIEAENMKLSIQALGLISPPAKEAIPFLIEGLDDPHKVVTCAFSLLKLGPEAKSAIPALEKVLQGDGTTPEVRQGKCWAAAALIAMEPDRAPSLLPRIKAALRSEDQDVRRQAAISLRNLRQGAKDAVPDLIDSALSGNRAAAQALEMIGVTEQEVARFAAALHDDAGAQDQDRRSNAADALFWIGPSAKDAIPALIEALEGPHRKLREKSAGDLQDQPRRWVRQWAAKALGKLGPEARDAIPALSALGRDWDKAMRAEARKALARIQKTPENGR